MSDDLFLEYNVTLDDQVFFNRYHYDQSPANRRMWFWSTWCPVLIVALLSVFAVLHHNVTLAVMGIIWIAILLLLALIFRGPLMDRLARKLYTERKNKGMLGKLILRITDEGITETSGFGENKRYWQGVERVVEVPGYAFVYISAVSAFVIPEQRVESGDYRAFVTELKRRWEAAQEEQATA